MKRFFLLFVFVWSASVALVRADGIIQNLRDKYVNMLVASDIQDRNSQQIRNLELLPADDELSDRCIVELYQRKAIKKQDITKILSTLKSDGSWSDINYQDKTRSGWKVKEHVERIFPMCRYYRVLLADHRQKQAQTLLGSIIKTINWWTGHNPISPNWWHNEVGIPKTFGSALLLVWDELPVDIQQEVIETVFEQHVRFGMTGQNKVWKAGNMLIRGLLTNDEEMVVKARKTIGSEIVTGHGEGIQKDWSYHQHGAQQQFGNYGLAYLSTMCFYFELFDKTSLAFTQEQHDILLNLLENGYSWIVWNGYMDVNCLNRQLFKHAASNKNLIVQFCSRSLKGKEVDNPLGNKHFPCSDMTVHRTNKWMGSIKMASNRVVGTEQMNGDNQQGYYTADGATFIYTKGNEYENIFPLWDWRKIPGVTCYQSEKQVPQEKTKVDRRNRTGFVGGISDGMLGVTAMQLNRNGMKAKKMWVFTKDFLLCLGTDIRTDSLPVATTIEQCNAQKGDKWNECMPGRYLMHDKGYIILDGSTPKAAVETRSGNWNKIMKTYRSCVVSGEVATMYIDHGMTHNGTYQYVVVPGSTARSLKHFKTETIKIHANTPEWQLVETTDGIFATIYKQNKYFTLSDGQQLNFDRSGIYLFQKENGVWKQTYVDPTER